MPLAVSDDKAVAIPLKAAAAKVSTTETVLPIPFVAQGDYQNLCWAACCAMVDQALKNLYPQQCSKLPTTVKAAATIVIDADKCATDPPSGVDRTCWPDCAMAVLGVPCSAYDGSVCEDSLVDKIVNNREPVMIYVAWTNGRSHVVLLTGYDPARKTFRMHNPLDTHCSPVTYDWLLTFGHSGTWKFTYYDIGFELG